MTRHPRHAYVGAGLLALLLLLSSVGIGVPPGNSSHVSGSLARPTDGRGSGFYPIPLVAEGIPNGTPWSLEIAGTAYHFTSPSESVRLPNGSYSYSLDSVNGYALRTDVGAPAEGRIVVDGPAGTSTLKSLGLGAGSSPSAIAYDASTQMLYVASSYNFNVTEISAGALPWRIVGNLSTGTTPSALALDPVTGDLWVANSGSNNLTVLDVTSGQVAQASIGVGTDPVALAVDPANDEVYVVNSGSQNVTVINGTSYGTIDRGIPVGLDPTAIAYDPANGDFLVADSGSNALSVLNGSTGQSVGTLIPVGSSPSGVTVATGSGAVVVTNAGNSNVTILNATTLRMRFASVPVGTGPIDPIYDPSSGYVDVANQGTNNLTVLNPATGQVVTKSVGTGPDPSGLALDSGAGLLAVISTSGNNLSAITIDQRLAFDYTTAPLYPVRWTATGLPAGTVWSVDFAGRIYTSSSPNLTISASNGTYAYTLEPVIDYSPAGVPSTGTLTIEGGQALQPLSPLVTGGGPDAGAYDNRTGALYLAGLNTTNITVLNASTYQVAAPPIDSPYAPIVAIAYDPADGFLYVGYDYGGCAVGVINGSSDEWVTNLTFSQTCTGSITGITYDPFNHDLYASMSSGSLLVVNGSSTNPSFVTEVSIGGSLAGSTVDPLTTNLWVANEGSNNLTLLNTTNNTQLSDSPVERYGPSAIVADALTGEMIVANEKPGGQYATTSTVSAFSDAHPNDVRNLSVPAGADGLVTTPLDQLLVASKTTNQLTLVSLPSLAVLARWSGMTHQPSFELYDPLARSILVANMNSDYWTVLQYFSTISIPFAPAPEYPVVFAESGLPPGTPWQVTLAGTTIQSAQPSIHFSISAGIFPYRIQGPVGYRLEGGSTVGMVRVVGPIGNLAVGGVLVGGSPDAAAYDPSNGLLYVANSQSDNVTVVDPLTMHTSGSSFSVGLSPSAIAYDPARGVLMVTNFQSGNVTVLDPATGRTVANIPVQYDPTSLAYDPQIPAMIVADSGSGNLTEINATTLQVVTNLSSDGGTPTAIVYDSSGDEMVVADSGSARVVAFHAGTLQIAARANLSSSISRIGGLAVNTSSGNLSLSAALASPSQGALLELTAGLSVTTMIGLAGTQPQGVVWDPSLNSTVVAGAWNDSVGVYSGALSSGTTGIQLPVGVDPTGLTYVPSTQELWVMNSGGRNLSVIGTGARVGVLWQRIPTYPAEFRETGLPDGSTWSVEVNGTRYSSTNSTLTVDLRNGSYPYEFLPVVGERLVYPAAVGTLRVQGSAEAILASGWAAGAHPSAIAYDPILGDLFVTDASRGVVTLLNASTGQWVGTVPVGTQPDAILDIPTLGLLVVANFGSNSLTVLNGSTGAAMGAAIPVGPGPRDLAYDPATQTLVVANFAGSNLTLVNLTLHRSVGTRPVGLDPVALAFDPANGWIYSANSGSNNLTGIDLADPTIPSMNIATGENPHGIAYDQGSQQLWITDFADGNLTILNITGATWTSATRPIGPYPDAIVYDPVNGHLYLTLGANHTVVSLEGSNASLVASDLLPSEGTSQLAFLAGEGEIAALNSTGGTLSLLNGNDPVASIWAPYEYPITFLSSGLPAGTGFSFAIGGSQGTGIAPMFEQSLANGSYSFRIGYVAGWSVLPRTGTVVVDGAGETVHLNWTPSVYGATVSESGLPNGTAWSIDLNGTNRTTTSDLMIWRLTNGSYPFVVAGVPGWSLSSYRGVIVVRGASMTLTLNWSEVTYPVEVTAVGIPNGTNWTLLVNGMPYSSPTTTLLLRLPNGTYHLTVVAPTGYRLDRALGNLTMSGSPPTQIVVIDFVSAAPPSTTALPGGEVVAITGGIAGVAATVTIAGVVRIRRRSNRPPP